jgi:hypothetical protein
MPKPMGDVMGTMADIFGGLLDFLSSFAQSGFFTKSFDSFMTQGDPSIPSIDISMKSLFTATKNFFMLSAGDVFFFKVSCPRNNKHI